MKTRLLLLFLLGVAVTVQAGHHPGKSHKHSDNVSISFDDNEDGVNDCGDVRVKFDSESAIRAEEQLQIPLQGTLQVQLERRGGLRVYGTSAASYEVRLCKAVATGSDELLRQIRLAHQGNRLTVQGPAEESGWAAYLLIGAPRGAALQAEASNAPISFQDVSGNFTATAVNGPVSVKDSTGVISARTTNGPISFAGSEGDVTLSATNGPLSVKLAGEQWRGQGLTAKTANGPVSIALPENYRSAVQITGGNGPWSCKGEICGQVVRTDDELRSMTIGPGTPLVRISANNGPVSIKTR